MNCAMCQNKACYTEGKVCVDYCDKGIPEYKDQKNTRILGIASELEAHYYMQLTRLEEIIRFIKEMNYQKVGIAFCVGLSSEAKIISEILKKYVTLETVCCKVGGINKKNLGLPNIKEERYEAACNPIGQAKVLNAADTELNIIIGLCIGHDILFTGHSEAPVTTLVVKDRVTTHNPLAAVYSSYYRKNKFGSVN